MKPESSAVDLVVLVDDNLLDPQHLSDDLVLLLDLFRYCLSLIEAVIARDPLQIFIVLSFIGAAVDLARLLDAASGGDAVSSAELFPFPLECLVLDSIAPEAPWQLAREESLGDLIPPVAKLRRIIRCGDEDRVLDHDEDIGIGAAEVLPPVVQLSKIRHHAGGIREAQRPIHALEEPNQQEKRYQKNEMMKRVRSEGDRSVRDPPNSTARRAQPNCEPQIRNNC